MSDITKKKTVVYVVPETVEGTYAPPVTGADAVQSLADGLEMSPSKELIDRNIARGGIGKVAGRPGQESVSAAIPVEFKAGSTSGAAPEYGDLLKAAMGAVRSVASPVTASTLDGATGTASRIPFANIDKNKYKVNDMVKVRHSSVDYIVRVVSVVNIDGTVSATVEPALGTGTFGAGDVVSAVTTYYTADTGHTTVSVTKELESNLLEIGVGCRVKSVSLNNFSTGQIADLGFSLEGLSFTKQLGGTALTPTFDTSEPPLILGAKVLLDGVEIEVNEVTFSLENTVAFKTATGAPKGKISSRITERSISGSFNPYKQDNNIDMFNRFNSIQKFGLMLSAHNPSGVTGQVKEVIAIYLPLNLITELGESDQDGLVQENVSFQADGASMFISFI